MKLKVSLTDEEGKNIRTVSFSVNPLDVKALPIMLLENLPKYTRCTFDKDVREMFYRKCLDIVWEWGVGLEEKINEKET